MIGTNSIYASKKDIEYDKLFELNYDYYMNRFETKGELPDDINYFINPLLGGIMKLRFENSIPYIKAWLKKKKEKLSPDQHELLTNIQIVFDYLYNNKKRWNNLQLVIPTVHLSKELIEELHLSIEYWVTGMKKAISTRDEKLAKQLHHELLDCLMKTKRFDFGYNFHRDRKNLIDYLHIIAERTNKDGKKCNRTVNLSKLFRDESWYPHNLVFEAMIKMF